MVGQTKVETNKQAADEHTEWGQILNGLRTKEQGS